MVSEQLGYVKTTKIFWTKNLKNRLFRVSTTTTTCFDFNAFKTTLYVKKKNPKNRISYPNFPCIIYFWLYHNDWETLKLLKITFLTKNLKNSLYNHHQMIWFERHLDPLYTFKNSENKAPTPIFP